MARTSIGPSCVLGIVLGLGCGPSTIDSGEGTGMDPSESSGSSGGTDGDDVCASMPHHGCLPRGDCSVEVCGEAGAPYDENGCLRGGCGSGDDCYPGEVCHRPIEWGGCASSSTSCELDPANDECVCSTTDDCNGAYCAVEGSVPSPACLEQTEEDACYALGCNVFETAPQLVLGPMGCICRDAEPICLFVPGEIGGEGALTPYFRTDGSGEVRLLSAGYFQDPVGWARCEGHPEAPESCGCDGCP